MLYRIAKCLMRLSLWIARIGRRKELLVAKVTHGKVGPSINEVIELSNIVATRRWLAGIRYGDAFRRNAGQGRHSFNQIIEHMIFHLLNLYSGVKDDQGPSVQEHLGAVLVGCQILCLYTQEAPHVFLPVVASPAPENVENREEKLTN